MSRVAKMPISLPKGVEFSAKGGSFAVTGPKGTLSVASPSGVTVSIDGSTVSIKPDSMATDAMAGTLRALLANCVKGVATGYERKLELVGLLVLLVATTSLVFLQKAVPLLFLAFPPMLMMALRQPPKIVGVGLIVMAGISAAASGRLVNRKACT